MTASSGPVMGAIASAGGWLASRGPGPRSWPMDELSGVAKRRAGKANGALMEALRGKLSVLLRTAHAKGLLPWACALHDEFRAEGTAARVYIDLDVEDE